VKKKVIKTDMHGAMKLWYQKPLATEFSSHTKGEECRMITGEFQTW
jgi:hypothetical protein